MQYALAEQALMEAIAIWEKLRVGLEDREAYRVSLFETQNNTYEILQQVRIALKKYPEALEVAEQGRARAFLALLASKLPRNELAQYAEPPVKVQQLQQIAREQNLTIVSYGLISGSAIAGYQPLRGSSTLYVWVISTKGEISFQNLNLESWETENGLLLTQMIQKLQERISSSSGTLRDFPVSLPRKPLSAAEKDQSPDELKHLYQLLIQPVETFLPKDPNAQVVFIPHKALALVPFAALREQSGRYLIEKHTISYAPSIQSLRFTQKLAQLPKGSTSLIIGNPNGDLPPLPQAAQEARGIAKLLNSQAAIGQIATKAHVLEQMPQANIIHLAMHGVFNDIDGLESALAFSSQSKLTAKEILKLQLQARLVVLSACNTAQGKITGDGVIGLARSFILAGAPSVIVSLWYVPDAETSQLMVDFYKNMLNNRLNRQVQQQSYAHALRRSMLTTMINHPHPRNWAAFGLIGAL